MGSSFAQAEDLAGFGVRPSRAIKPSAEIGRGTSEPGAS